MFKQGFVIVCFCLILGFGFQAMAASLNGRARYERSVPDNSQPNNINWLDGSFPYFEFQKQFFESLAALQSATQKGMTEAASTGGATVAAFATYQPSTDQILQQQKAFFDNLQKLAASGSTGAGSSDGSDANYAASSVSFGPDGAYQTAYIQPENPDTPNVVNRFAQVSPDGFKSFTVSSSVQSSDINGQKSSHRTAETSINNNGRVVTYKVQN